MYTHTCIHLSLSLYIYIYITQAYWEEHAQELLDVSAEPVPFSAQLRPGAK